MPSDAPHTLKPHDPQHPYVKNLKGCGHGVLFTDYCRDCEIVGLLESYHWAIRQAQSAALRLRALGCPLPTEKHDEAA